MYSFRSIYFYIFLITLYVTNAKISDKRECVDSKCEEPISKAKTLMPYNSIENGVLSFKANVDVTVFSYGAGERADWWGIELNGQRGYAPKIFLREIKKLNKPTLLVDTDIISPQVPSERKKQVIPQKVLEPYDVIDGTTIFHDSNIAPSSTQTPILPTATPVPDSKSNVNENVKKAVEDVPQSLDSVSKANDDEAFVEVEEANEEYGINGDHEGDDDDDDGEDEGESKSVYQEMDNHNKSSLKNPVIDEITTPTPIVEKELEHDKPHIAPLNPTKEEPKSVYQETDNDKSSLKNSVADESTTPPPIVEKELKEGNPYIPALNPTTNIKDGTLKRAETTKEQEIVPQALSNKENNVEPLVLSTSLLSDTEIEKDKDAINKKNAASESLVATGDRTDEILKSPSSEQGVVDLHLVLNDTVPVDPVVDQITSEVPSHPVPSSEIVVETKEEMRQEYKDIDVNLSNESKKNSNETPKSSTGDHNNTKSESEPPFIFDDNKHPPPSEIKLENPLPIFGNLDITTMGSSSSIEQSKQDVETNEIKPIDNNENVSEFASGRNFEQLNQEVMDTVNEQVNINSNEAPEINEGSNEVQIPNPIVENDNQEEVNAEADAGGIINNLLSFFTQDDNSEIKEDTGLETKPDIREVPENEETFEVPLPNSFDQGIKPNSQDTGVNSENNNQNEHGTEPGVEYTSTEESLPQHQDLMNNNQNQHGTEPGVEYTSTEESLPQHQDLIHASDKNINEIVENYKIEDRIQNDPGRVVVEDDGMILTLKNYIPFEFPALLPSNDLHSDFFVYLLTTAISVTLFLFGYLAMDKNKRVGPLIARINKLEQQLLITMKENEMLQESATPFHIHETAQVVDNVSSEEIEKLTQKLAEMQITKTTLEEQIQALEKELDTSTEVGMELNKIVSDMLNSSNNGSDVIKESIEQMKRQLLEQQDTINSVTQTLSFTETENHELRLDLDISNKKVSDLQLELDKMAEKVLKIEEEKDQQQHTLEIEIVSYQQKFNEAFGQGDLLRNEIQVLRTQLAEALREADIKVKEFNELKSSLKDIKAIKNNSEAMKSLLEVSSIKAELHQLKIDSSKYKEQLRLEQEAHLSLGKQYQSLLDDTNVLREKYDFADKEKLEVKTKLDVLNNYFKEKESQMQKEISKYESLWAAKEGEATSTTERVKYMQDELQNYKSQNETLKQEIMNQEVELKSQISVLEKKVHENWVTNRQLERKLEEAKQEAGQLRNRLTLSERALTEGNAHMRILPPMQNGELPFSPLPIESPASPPLIYGGRDHITKSPPLGGLPPPPPFLPPPIGGPFMPPHLPGMPPFMPPPPSVFPGDRRPPPLGRMSSPPPMMMRYSPESTAYSGYDRNSPSPPYDSEYGTSPPPMRSYSPYERENRREYNRPHNRSNGRTNKGSSHLNSGSGRSNDSLDELYSKPSKKV